MAKKTMEDIVAQIESDIPELPRSYRFPVLLI